MAAHAGREIELVAGKPAAGGTARRCPDISKLGKLGYKPRVTLGEGLKPTLDWYWRNTRARAKLTMKLTSKETTSLAPHQSRARRRHRRKRSDRKLSGLRPRAAR